jgi:release factor glutamine methyltransferase
MNEIEAIFCKLLNCDRASLYIDKHKSFLTPRKAHDLEKILRKRISGEPLQYLLGDAEFMGLNLRVKPGVLIPRPETELLVEAALEVIKSRKPGPYKALDIGTGSGNIAIALAKFGLGRGVRVDTVDISDDCLDVAAMNARQHGVDDRIRFIRSDIFSKIDENAAFDMIISNPPYVAECDYAALPEDVKREPFGALVAPHEGLYFYEEIEKGARRHCADGGRVFLELGAGQADAVKKMFSDKKIWSDVSVIKDYNGIDRVFAATRETKVVLG